MALVLHFHDPRELNKAEQVLRDQPGVVDAEVWHTQGRMVGRVVVDAETHLQASDLQHACLLQLGTGGTPTLLMLERALRQAA